MNCSSGTTSSSASAADWTAARGRGAAVVLEGPAGIGKTSLVAAARRLAADRGLRSLAARGGELERDFAYGVVRQLFERPWPQRRRAPGSPGWRVPRRFRRRSWARPNRRAGARAGSPGATPVRGRSDRRRAARAVLADGEHLGRHAAARDRRRPALGRRRRRCGSSPTSPGASRSSRSCCSPPAGRRSNPTRPSWSRHSSPIRACPGSSRRRSAPPRSATW